MNILDVFKNNIYIYCKYLCCCIFENMLYSCSLKNVLSEVSTMHIYRIFDIGKHVVEYLILENMLHMANI